MTDKQKKMLMEQIVDDVICDFVDISSGDLVLHYTNNTEDVRVQKMRSLYESSVRVLRSRT